MSISFGPIPYLHKWWARRCGSTFRTILKQFVADATSRDYYSVGGLEGKSLTALKELLILFS